jgi:ankyrin repeat protein
MAVWRKIYVLVVAGCLSVTVCTGCGSSRVADTIGEDQQGPDVSTLTNEELVFRYTSTGDADKLEAILSTNPELANVRDPGDYRTPLHVAAATGNEKTVKVLLDHGADPNARDDNNETPADAARQQAHLELSRELDKISTASAEQ